MNLQKKMADALRAALPQIRHLRQALENSGRVIAARDHKMVEDEISAVLEEHSAQTAVPANVVFAWGERSALSGGLPLVTMTQQGPDRFTVRYGMQVRARLDYSSACTELGAAIMHALACDSLIDNRTKAEARRDGDA